MRNKILIISAAASFLLGVVYLKNKVFLNRLRKESEEELSDETSPVPPPL